MKYGAVTWWKAGQLGRAPGKATVSCYGTVFSLCSEERVFVVCLPLYRVESNACIIFPQNGNVCVYSLVFYIKRGQAEN